MLVWFGHTGETWEVQLAGIDAVRKSIQEEEVQRFPGTQRRLLILPKRHFIAVRSFIRKHRMVIDGV